MDGLTLSNTSYLEGSMAWQIFCMFDPKKKPREDRMRMTKANTKAKPTALDRAEG